ISGEHVGLSQGAAPFDLVRQAEAPRSLYQCIPECAAADMDEAPFQFRGQEGKRRKQVFVPLFGNQPPDREEDDRMFRVAAVAHTRSRGRWWKSLDVEPVIT